MDNTEKALILIGSAAVIYFAFLRKPGAAVPVTPAEYDVMNLRDEMWHQCARAVIDPAVVSAIIEVESGGNPNVQDGADGEIGVMQILPGTAAQYCSGTTEDLRDPAKNIACGVQYLQFLVTTFEGAIEPILAAYNAGPGSVATDADGNYVFVNPEYVAKTLPLIDRYKELWMQTAYRDEYESLFAWVFLFGVNRLPLCGTCGGR